jgi:hypothetical protein
LLSKSYQDKFIYNAIDDINTAYELIVLPEIKGNVIVVITALEKDSDISITNFYERVATQVYDEHLQETRINNIIWIEQIIHQEIKKAFFQVDLIWHEDLRSFCSPQWNPCDEKIIAVIKTFCSKASYSQCVH